MHKIPTRLSLLPVLALLLLFTYACEREPLAVEGLAIPDIAIDTTVNGHSSCPANKPDDIGCTTMCKPCITWQCVNREWVRVDIDWSDGICDPLSPPDPPPFSCPRTPEGFCPAECSICF